MAKKTKAKSRSKSSTSGASSWWKERSKILAQRTEAKPKKAKAKKVRTKKAARAEKGMTYYCEVCGCEMVCVEPSAETIVCCGEPMSLVC